MLANKSSMILHSVAEKVSEPAIKDQAPCGPVLRFCSLCSMLKGPLTEYITSVNNHAPCPSLQESPSDPQCSCHRNTNR